MYKAGETYRCEDFDIESNCLFSGLAHHCLSHRCSQPIKREHSQRFDQSSGTAQKLD